MTTRRIAALVLTLALAGCGGDHDHAGHDHDAATDDHVGHVHTAPRGGALIVLAEETAHLELLFETATGRVDLYSLGPHATQPVRLADPALTVFLSRDGEMIKVDLQPVASALTGETVGDTSYYSGKDERLVGAEELKGTLLAVTSRGATYQNVQLRWPP